MARSYWFKRFKEETEALSPHIRFIYLKLGFWRIYWRDHYMGEVYEEMGPLRYIIKEYDMRLDSQKYVEEYELHEDLVRKVKNFVEGYYDSKDRFRTRLYLLQHDDDFFERSRNIYKNSVNK